MADIDLAGRVIASHYAEPIIRSCALPTTQVAVPGGEVIAMLEPGSRFAVLDCGGGFAWGYAVADHRVGYIDLSSLA